MQVVYLLRKALTETPDENESFRSSDICSDGYLWSRSAVPSGPWKSVRCFHQYLSADTPSRWFLHRPQWFLPEGRRTHWEVTFCSGLIIFRNHLILFSSFLLIELFVYSGANSAFYRVMSIPNGSKNIEIKYMGLHWCDFKYADSKLYVLPKSDDSSISYKVSLVRRTRPIFSTIDFSDFSNITGEIITPTPD